MPLNFAKRKTIQAVSGAVSGTTHRGIRIAKGSLSNISVQAGPFISVRPFDFK